MSNIKRYEAWGRVNESDDGEICFYEDVERLKDELEKRKLEVERLELAIWSIYHHEWSSSPDAIQNAINECLDGKYEESGRRAKEDCIKEWS